MRRLRRVAWCTSSLPFTPSLALMLRPVGVHRVDGQPELLGNAAVRQSLTDEYQQLLLPLGERQRLLGRLAEQFGDLHGEPFGGIHLADNRMQHRVAVSLLPTTAELVISHCDPT